MGNANVPDHGSWPRAADSLHHRLLGTHTLEHRIRAYTLRKLLDAGHSRLVTLRNDVGCAKLEREILPLLIPAHRDDPRSTHLFRSKHAHESNRSIPTTATVAPAFTRAASAAYQPVPSTSDAASKL